MVPSATWTLPRISRAAGISLTSAWSNMLIVWPAVPLRAISSPLDRWMTKTSPAEMRMGALPALLIVTELLVGGLYSQ